MPEKHYYKVDPNKLIIRDHLAADRTSLANERTLLSYIRTALGFGATGFGLIKLFENLNSVAIIVIGWILIVFAFVIFVFGFARFFKFKRQISSLTEGINVIENDKEKE
ncbi:MAG: DUF202 domain-containing protein [Candidatus Heimdallarchaeota archaeon]|nr:DUF202 domain-containing protein [Candidatus Heimdallarchaeota archaeon]